MTGLMECSLVRGEDKELTSPKGKWRLDAHGDGPRRLSAACREPQCFNQITRERERILMALLQALSPWLSERKQPKQKNRS